MMIYRGPLFACTLLLAARFGAFTSAAQQSKPSGSQPAGAQANAKQTYTPSQPTRQTQTDGERIFAQNCSRCHTAPDGFSPRISGTVVRHMRVRASLSQHDEQELLRFLNP